MTDLEISKTLALAIGYLPQHIQTYDDKVSVFRPQINFDYSGIEHAHPFLWRQFDYRDWPVIGPIAAKYNAFPTLDPCDEIHWTNYAVDTMELIHADTPQKAIALAVIGAKT